MTDRRSRFDPSELELELDHEAAGLLATARALEAYAESTPAAPSSGFEDRVMAAIATEPLPRPTTRHGLLAMLRDAWAGAFGPGRPLAVRAQAFALLLVVAVAVGSLGSLAAVGAARLLSPDQLPPIATPSPTPSPIPTPSPSPSPSVSPSPSPTVAPSTAPTAAPTATETETDEPSGTDDSGGGGGNSGPGGGGGDR